MMAASDIRPSPSVRLAGVAAGEAQVAGERSAAIQKGICYG